MVYGIIEDTLTTTHKIADDTANTIKFLNDEIVEPFYEEAGVVFSDTLVVTDQVIKDSYAETVNALDDTL